MEKFNCAMCGKCCRVLRNFNELGEEEKALRKKEYQNTNEKTIFYILPEIEKASLALFEFEVEHLKQLAKEKNIVLKIAPLKGFLSSDGTPIIFNWMLDHDSCPFLENNRCLIYDDRPLVCQSFPLFTSAASALEGEKKIMIFPSNLCPSMKATSEITGQMTFDDFRKKLCEVYGDIFPGSVKFDLTNFFIEKYIEALMQKGLINVTSKITRDEFINRCQKSSVSLFDFMLQKRLARKEELEDLPNRVQSIANEIIK